MYLGTSDGDLKNELRLAVFGKSQKNGGTKEEQFQHSVFAEMKKVYKFMHKWIHNKYRMHVWGWMNPNINVTDWFVATINDVCYQNDSKKNVK